MTILLLNLGAVSIAAIFYLYRTANESVAKHRRKLRERVAYMLWAASNDAG